MSISPLDQLLNQRSRFLAFVRRRVADAALAEDILQTCYLRAFEHQNDFDPAKSAEPFFYRLLRNAVIDSYRRKKVRDEALEEWAKAAETAAILGPELENEVCGCLHGVVDDLKPGYAEVLRAVDLEGQRVQDFAEKHEITVSNAGVRVHRARAALRKQMLQTCMACAERGCLDCTCSKREPSAS